MALPSLEILLDQVQAHRNSQERQFEGMDTKAGIVLGLSGAAAALVARGSSMLAGLSAVAAGIAALMALWSFFPRKFPVLDLRPLRDKYLRVDDKFTSLHLLDAHIVMADRAARLIERKARHLKLAVLGLALAVMFSSADALLA